MSKKETASEAIVEPACFKGKFLNGIQCNSNLIVIQLVDPLIDSIDVSYVAADTNTYSAAIGLFIDDEYKDGQVFYFTLDTIYRTPAQTANCFNVPKYTGVIQTISRTGCSVSTE